MTVEGVKIGSEIWKKGVVGSTQQSGNVFSIFCPSEKKCIFVHFYYVFTCICVGVVETDVQNKMGWQWRGQSMAIQSMFETDGEQMHTNKNHTSKTKGRKGETHTGQQGTVDSEVWGPTTNLWTALNGTNEYMVSVITGNTIREESTDGKLFNLVKWIRVRRLQWIGHTLRMTQERKVKQTAYVMFKTL